MNLTERYCVANRALLHYPVNKLAPNKPNALEH